MRHLRAPDLEIASIAARQGGVIAAGQLAGVGLSKYAIRNRVGTGRLHPLHRAVYAVGHPRVPAAGRRWAAVLAAGDGAVLSHGSAGDAWGLRKNSSPRMHVTLAAHNGRQRRAGVIIHRVATLDQDEVTRLDGLPITTPARTVLDLAAGGLRGRHLEQALDHAERVLKADWAAFDALLARHAGRPGAPALAATLARYVPGSIETFSVLEEIVLQLCDDFDLPRPLVNTVIEGKRRDFHWPRSRLVVEADSYAWHRSPSALNADRERDVRLQLAGFIALRFTYEQCTQGRRYVRESILRGLGAR